MSDFSSNDSHLSSFFSKKELIRQFFSDGTTVEASPVRLIHSFDAPMTSYLNSSEVKDSCLDSETFRGYVDPLKSNTGPSLVESPSSRKKRLQRERVHRCRSKRSKEEAENAKKHDRQRHKEKRAVESAFERSKRRRSEAARKAFRQEAETQKDRSERLAKDAELHSDARQHRVVARFGILVRQKCSRAKRGKIFWTTPPYFIGHASLKVFLLSLLIHGATQPDF